MVSSLIEIEPMPQALQDPVLVTGFAVRRRAGRHPQTVLSFLADAWKARLVAKIEAEPFMDLTVRRPDIQIAEGTKPTLSWPETTVYHARPPGSERDVFLLIGFEPHFYWRTYSQAIREYASRLGIRTILTLRSFPGSVPHTRPAPVTVIASKPELEASLGLRAGGVRYEGPTDISGVIAAELQSAGCETADLLVLQPYYFPRGPNARVSIALIEPLDRLLNVQTDVSELEKLAAVQTEEINESYDADPDGARVLHELEDAYDSGSNLDIADEDDLEIPSPDEVIEEVERFLQDLGDDQDPE